MTTQPSDAHRSVTIARTAPGTFRATNARGGTFDFGSGGDDQFTPVELLLTAIAGCTGIDVDIFTTRRSEPTRFEVVAEGDKLRDEHGNHMGPIDVTFRIAFPEGTDGDAARAVLPDAIQKSHERLCTVSRTVALPTEVTMHQAD
ncbi:OsmC family protein [Flexivirga sp.]|uniref:OsmC family protein n=1 Tax=Flexivirga sp. TaxID=1962927 RepID=UPI003F81191F